MGRFGLGLGLGLSRRGGGGASLPAYFSNFTATNTAQIRTALKNARAGTGRGRISFCGDSNTGTPRALDDTFQNSRNLSFPNVAADKLEAEGIPTTRSSVCGSQGVDWADFPGEYQTAVAASGGWGIPALAGQETAGGWAIVNTTDQTAFAFTPAEVVDTFEIYFPRSAGGTSEFVWNIDGGADSAPVSHNDTRVGILKIDRNTAGAEALATPGTHTLNIKKTAGAPAAAVRQIIAYNSEVPAVEFINMGWRGATTGDWNDATNHGSPKRIIPYVLPDCTVINLGINNMRNNTAADAQYTTDMNALIDYFAASGDVILMVPFPIATSGSAGSFCSEVNQATWRAAIYDIAASRNLPVIDLARLFGSHAQAVTDGYAYDELHPNIAGYDLIAGVVKDALLHVESLGADDWVTADVAARVSRMSAVPARDKRMQAARMVRRLTDIGVWAQVDLWYDLADETADAARRNFKSGSFDCTVVGAPTHTPRVGYIGDGVDDALDTNFNPTTAPSPHFTQDSAHLFIWSLTDSHVSASVLSADFGEATRAYMGRANNIPGQMAGRMCSATGVTAAIVGAYPGYFGWSRDSSTVWEGYDEGVDAGGGTLASAALANATLRILSTSASTFGVNRLALAHAGGELTASQVAAARQIVRDYYQASGLL